MIKLTANQISDLLRKCSSTNVCEGCPFHPEHPHCIKPLMQHAAGMIEGMQGMIEQQAETITKIRTFVRSNK